MIFSLLLLLTFKVIFWKKIPTDQMLNKQCDEIISKGDSFFFCYCGCCICGFSSITLWLRLNYYTHKIGGHRYHWISHKMNIRHPGQLKKWKSWGPFWSYQLNITANPAHLPQNWANWPNWRCCLAGSSKTAPRILIFSIVLGAEYSFYVKSIATYAPQKVDIIIHS